MTLASDRYWSEVETWPRERLADLQRRRLREQLQRVAERSPFYRRQWRALGFEPGDVRSLEDVRALPIVGKADMAAALESVPPWGELLAVPPAEVARVHFSSGTTGRPTPMTWTALDLDRWADLYARSAWSQGVRPHDVYQASFAMTWFVGGLGATAGYGRLGCTVIPAGSGDTERQLDVIERFGTTALGITPSFALHLAEAAREHGRPVDGSSVRRIQVGGEPGGAVPATRASLEELWGARVYDGYGSLEFQPIAWECEEQAGGHLAEDFALAEVLDPENLEPVRDGHSGVLVLTHLDREATPLVRWWTGDVVVRSTDPCACGRTLARLPGGVLGRHDDMMIVRGVNLFPSAIEDVVRRIAGGAGEHHIVIDDDVTDARTGYLNGIKVRVELDPSTANDVAEKIAHAIRADLGVGALVEPVGRGFLPRATHKARRVVRASDGIAPTP